MDRKSILILAVCFALLLLWSPLINHLFPPPPPSTNTVMTAASPMPANTSISQGTNQPAAAVAAEAATSPMTVPTSNAPGRFVVSGDIPEQLLTITNAEARYVFTSRGGGLKFVELTRYPAKVSRRRQKPAETNDFARLNAPGGPPVFAILGQGSETMQGDGVFTLTPTTAGVRAEKLLTNGLAVIKDFRIGTNYLLTASVRFENRSAQPLALPPQEWVVGTATPMDPQDKAMTTMSVLWYDGTKTYPVSVPYFNTNTTSFFVFRRTPLTEFHAGNTNVVWVSAQNQFFALATMPANPAAALTVRMVDLPQASLEEVAASPLTVKAPKGLLAALNYPAQVLKPGQADGQVFNIFAGPKEYRILARVGARFDNNLEWVMAFNGFLGWFAKALLTGMSLLHASLGLPFGWAIVVITVLIKLVFGPLTQYSTRSMKRMQALQPQMKALQEKYKDDPQKMSQKQMEFWRKNKVNPLSGCLPMLLQLPLLWGFYRMLLSAIELRGASFLWIGDLSKPDTIFNLPIPLFGMDSIPVNPMPLLMGATMLWQSHLTPPSPGMDPAQQKMMRYMPLIFLVFMYNFSSGLALYWTVQNLLSVLQTKLIRNADVTPAPAAITPLKKR